MKIGQFSESFLPVVDGVGRVVYSYSKGLVKMGHEVYVVTPESDSGFRGKYPFEIVDFYGMPLRASKQYNVGVPAFDPHYERRIKNIDLDILHAHSPFLTGEEAYRIKRRREIPLIATFHSKYYDDFYKVTGIRLMAEMGTMAVVNYYNRCDDVWAVSDATATVLHDYGYDKEIFVMDNGTDITQPDEKWRKKAVNAFNIPKNKNVLLFVGQINYKKNIRRIVEAIKILSDKSDEYYMIFAGQGPDEDDIKRLVDRLGIKNFVNFTGHISDSELLFGLYMAADIFVFPSIYDNAPLVLREAACMYTPAIVAEGSSAAAIIEHDKNGFTTEDDSYHMADLIERIFADEELLKRAGEGARSTIPVGWDIILKKVEERYKYIENTTFTFKF